MQGVQEMIEGGFDGIGVAFNMMTDTAVVLTLIPSGPSERAGVRTGDRIIRIDDSLVAGQKLPQLNVVRMLRGPRDTKVKLGLQREGISQPVEIEITRGPIPLHSVETAFMIADGIGYLKLSQFTTTSYGEVKKALSPPPKLSPAAKHPRGGLEGVEEMRGLILDLRGNVGGIYDQSVKIANEFLPAGAMIVYTEDRNRRRVEEHSNGKGAYQHVPLVVLIDEHSASASEILAGALQDNDRATIIGRQSFGKGLVQKQIPFEDSTAVRLTVARYYTPTGRSIQKPYGTYVADTVSRVTPGGRVLQAGGGIMPDVEMPVDTLGVTPYLVEVVYRNILSRYTLDYTDRHRVALDNITSLAQLDAFFDRDKNLVNDFVRYAARQGVKPNYKQIAESRPILEAQLRANIGRNTPLGATALHAEAYAIDKTMQRAVEILEKQSKP